MNRSFNSEPMEFFDCFSIESLLLYSNFPRSQGNISMKKAFRLTQLLSNIAIILIAFMFGFVIVKQYLNPHSTQVSSVAPNTSVNNESPAVKTVPTRVSPVGKTVPLENVNWHENQRTLVLYISTTCRYCNESAAFYRSLLAKAGRNAKFIAVLPQTVTEARQHLKSQELNIE